MDETYENTHNEYTAHSDERLHNLADWLRQLMQYPEQDGFVPAEIEVLNQFEAPFVMQYHPTFYQRLPDFILALLQNDPHALTDYAPLLYHLVGCTVCREAYIELYDPMKEAMQVQGERPIGSEVVRPLSGMSPHLLVQFSALLINQAEALLRQARHEHSDNNAHVRSLLQLAMRISTHLTQQGLRSHALHDLVRVASLYAGESSPDTQHPAALSFISVPAGTGGTRQRHVLRSGELATQLSGQATIDLQANAFEGNVIQHEDMLELQLHGLNQSLRGHRLAISVPLGSLIEPVRWIGGNPRAILATSPVDDKGMLKMSLGQTELRLQNQEERELLEVMFSLLEVRVAD